MSDFYAEAFVGWRAWRLHKLERKLTGPYLSTKCWPYRAPFRATCDVDERHAHDKRYAHASPSALCKCGIYAMKEQERVHYHEEREIIYGSVSLWGHIVEHEIGYRAQFGYPKELIIAPYHMRYLTWLSDYGVPVRMLGRDDWRAFVMSLGRELQQPSFRVAQFALGGVAAFTARRTWSTTRLSSTAGISSTTIWRG
jgi:hypothetical protein